LKRELALARSWATELEEKNDRLQTQLYMLEVQQNHEGQQATETQGIDQSSSVPVIDTVQEDSKQ
jgi:hypothetical protein